MNAPTAALKRQAKAAEYRARATDAATLAKVSALANVRERHQAAAAKWNELAELYELVGAVPSA